MYKSDVSLRVCMYNQGLLLSRNIISSRLRIMETQLVPLSGGAGDGGAALLLLGRRGLRKKKEIWQMVFYAENNHKARTCPMPKKGRWTARASRYLG